jgi:hypothetical protein
MPNNLNRIRLGNQSAHETLYYRVAALFPEHFQSLNMAFPFVFFNNSFGTHCLSYLQKHNKQQTDTFQKICGNKKLQ